MPLLRCFSSSLSFISNRPLKRSATPSTTHSNSYPPSAASAATITVTSTINTGSRTCAPILPTVHAPAKTATVANCNLPDETGTTSTSITRATTSIVLPVVTMTSHAAVSSDEPLGSGMPTSDHDSDASDDHDLFDPKCVIAADDNDDNDMLCGDGSCVVCFERPTNITFDPCGHANLCDVCVSRLVKRRCPTCRARAKRVTIRYHGCDPVTKAVRDVIAERKQRETRVLEDTLQIVFLGPEKVGKKTLVRKLMAKYPLVKSSSTQQQQHDVRLKKETQRSSEETSHEQYQSPEDQDREEGQQEDGTSNRINNNSNNNNNNSNRNSQSNSRRRSRDPEQTHEQQEQVSSNQPDGNSNPSIDESPVDVFGDGTDFSANATIAGCNVRLTVLRRTTLASRRMVLDDVRVLKPDVLVLCCSAHVGSTFDAIQTWDKVLRTNFQKPRVWALLTLDDSEAEMTATAAGTTATGGIGVDSGMGGSTTHSLDRVLDVNGAINAVFPPDVRPKGHYYWSRGESFSIGFRSLAKDIVSMGRLARSEEVVASYAAEARQFADHNHAPMSSDSNNTATIVLANNGIAVAANTGSQPQGNSRSAGSRSGSHVGRSFSWRGLRDRNGHGPGIIWSGLVNWLAGSHES